MRASATLEVVEDGAIGGEVWPVVLVDGAPEARLRAAEFRATHPLDERVVTLTVDAAPVERTRLVERWRRARRAAILWPARLMDEQLRPIVLAHGKLRASESESQAGSEAMTLELVDDWAAMLSHPLPGVWRERDGAAEFDTPGGALGIGDHANRSASTYEIHGRFVHLPTTRGASWTVGDALATLLAMANVECSLLLVPEEVRRAPLLREIDLALSLGKALERVMTPYDLVIQRTIERRGGRIVERRAVRAGERGRVTTIAWPGRGASALSIVTDAPGSGARLWEARARGWRVESTFVLVAGWDPALEAAADTELSKASSMDFARYANVYRLWVLNEDGWFTAEPFNHPRFDAAALFGLDVIEPRALRFLPCLTRDDAGSARAVMLEVSVDGGETWSTYAGRWANRSDRAAVYLDDGALDSAFLSAARTGQARVRVTASLQSPASVRVRRWRGNAFMGESPAHVIDAGEAFEFRKVDAGSIYHEGVRSGELAADEADDRAALDRFLIERMRAEARLSGRSGRARVAVSGGWPVARIGDRVVNAGGPRRDAGGVSEAIAGRGAVVRGVVIRWEKPGPRSVKAAPATEVELGV